MKDRYREADAGVAAPRARLLVASALAVALAVALAPATAGRAATGTQPTVDGDAERAGIETWRAERIRRLTSDTGWLTLAGLFWLKEGENSFGRASSNALVLDHPSLADTAGSFVLHDHRVRFVARPGGGVTHDAKAVSSLELVADTQGEPTVLASGSLRLFIIERAGNLGVRVRDLDNPHRRNFRGFSYFPVSTDWVFDARFEPYEPVHRLKIVNILGMEEDAVSPGAVVFTRDGREWRLDTVLESPGDKELFLMFADETSGHETYGAGRFLYIPMPEGRRAQLDFNKAYNPPCALNDFATCPLPPPQNRLRLRVEAGEKAYDGGHGHHS
jgi:uncharacterized protein